MRYGGTVSPWVRGLAAFAAVMMMAIGVLHVLAGIAAIARNQFFVVGPNYVYQIDVTTWGWIHLLLGVFVAVSGFFVTRGAWWARGVGVAIAALSLVANFLFIPYYPLWSLLIIALDVAVIWTLCVYGREQA
ncbi:MAG: hypothetical protein JOY78_03220 [Pseudonocardia sp.]|nr:hypothetical protein [Pseudonocardia sp.]